MLRGLLILAFSIFMFSCTSLRGAGVDASMQETENKQVSVDSVTLSESSLLVINQETTETIGDKIWEYLTEDTYWLEITEDSFPDGHVTRKTLRKGVMKTNGRDSTRTQKRQISMKDSTNTELKVEKQATSSQEKTQKKENYSERKQSFPFSVVMILVAMSVIVYLIYRIRK